VRKTNYNLSSGEEAEIEISEEGDLITIRLSNQEKGNVCLTSNEDLDGFYITHLDLEQCKGQGIGRECLKFHKRVFSMPLAAASPYRCEQNDDGSHLTGDGLPFIAKMRDEGVVCRHPDEYENG